MYKNVKGEMARRGLTLKDVASKLKISISTLSSKMNGKYNFTLNEAKQIKKVLDTELTLEELFEEAS